MQQSPNLDLRRSFLPLLALLIAAFPLAAQEGPSSPPTPSLVVSGSAELDVEPDRAVVRLGVEAQRAEAAEAQGEVNRVANAILDAATGLDVDRRSIQTSQLSLYPVYSDRRRPATPGSDDAPPEVVGYRASNVVSVTLDELTKVGPVVDAAITAGANAVQGISFELEDDRAARSRALTRAIEDARSKAEAMAGALGMELGAVIEAQEGGSSVQPPPYPRMVRMEMATAQDQSTPVSPGTVTVSASVSVRYRLDP